MQRLAPAFFTIYGNFIAQGVQPFAPMVRPWDFQEPETTVNRGFPDHIEKGQPSPSGGGFFCECIVHRGSFIVCRGSFVVHRFGGQMPASGFERIGPQGGRDGFAFGETLV